MQRQKERAERKRLLYVALTRARDHLIMSGTLPDDVQPFEFAKTRIEWVYAGLGVTAEGVAAGFCDASGIRVRLIFDPLGIPAEFGEVKLDKIEIPASMAKVPDRTCVCIPHLRSIPFRYANILRI